MVWYTHGPQALKLTTFSKLNFIREIRLVNSNMNEMAKK